MAKRRGKRAARAPSSAASLPISQKINLVVKNLVAFVILVIISFIFYELTPAGGFFNDLFFLLMVVFGFVGLAFLIVWLVLLLMKPR